ncbi:hypothetical protein PR048_009666 [Dryococelus australis]|uniref:Uncharacterized protein n=1 Tax=Dryococelus australis TaxID=614101 RepID=A0ABQ9I0L2_9NEOP|nr:hypothetical protein PR048_009666 [Dryococelus australis]
MAFPPQILLCYEYKRGPGKSSKVAGRHFWDHCFSHAQLHLACYRYGPESGRYKTANKLWPGDVGLLYAGSGPMGGGKMPGVQRLDGGKTPGLQRLDGGKMPGPQRHDVPKYKDAISESDYYDLKTLARKLLRDIWMAGLHVSYGVVYVYGGNVTGREEGGNNVPVFTIKELEWGVNPGRGNTLRGTGFQAGTRGCPSSPDMTGNEAVGWSCAGECKGEGSDSTPRKPAGNVANILGLRPFKSSPGAFTFPVFLQTSRHPPIPQRICLQEKPFAHLNCARGHIQLKLIHKTVRGMSTITRLSIDKGCYEQGTGISAVPDVTAAALYGARLDLHRSAISFKVTIVFQWSTSVTRRAAILSFDTPRDCSAGGRRQCTSGREDMNILLRLQKAQG